MAVGDITASDATRGSRRGSGMEDLTDELSEEERWEPGRYVEFHHPERGLRVGRVQKTYTRGVKKKKVLLALTNPYTGGFGNRGGYRKYTILVDKSRIIRFYGKRK
jgi:hypothetical protein